MSSRRRANFKIALTLMAASAGAIAADGAGERLMDCHDQVVQYGEPSVVPLAGRLSVKPLPGHPQRVLEELDPEFIPESPQGTAAFNRVVTVDSTKPGPRSSVVEVFSIKGSPEVAWQIEAVDPRDNLRLQWLNEELLLVQVWWGRIVSTDLIFELRTGQFIYAKEANYGLLVQPCDERGTPVKSRPSREALPGDG